MKTGWAALAAVALSLASGGYARAQFEEQTSTFPYKLPVGILQPPLVPADNPLNDAKVDLGKRLYFDKRLSKNNTISCATCHNPTKGWTDQSPVSTGIHGLKGTRSAPTVLNAAYNLLQFWDGRAPSLEEQAKGPIQNPVEMGFSLPGVVRRLKSIRGYAPLFKKAFGNPGITIERVVRAIASFERTVITGNAPYDRLQAGDATAMSREAQKGMAIFFGKGNCSVCHTGFNFSDSDFHNIGVGMSRPKPDLGRFDVTKEDRDRGAFKTPTLRNLKDTAPYMHDGSVKTLSEVVDFYDRGGEPNQWLDGRIKPLHLTASEKKELLSFLDALTGDPVNVQPPTLPQ